MSEESTGEFNIHEAAAEIIGESDSQEVSTNETQPEGQPEGSQETGENNQLSPEEILNQVANEKEDPEQFADLLKSVNQMGLMGNGMPLEIKSPEHLKQLLEMGAGFYGKTEAHANEVKAKEAEFQQKDAAYKEREAGLVQKEQEFSEQLQINQIMGSIVARLQSEDPELFNHLDQLYRQEEKSIFAAKPLEAKFNGEIQKLNSEIQSLKGQKQTEELGKIKQGWEKDLSDLQTKFAAPIQKLGVKPNYDKVKEVWAADMTGNMTVEQAFYAVHGQDIAKAHESHRKLLETKAKSNARMLSRTGVGSGQKGKDETVEYSTGDYGSILRQASATM